MQMRRSAVLVAMLAAAAVAGACAADGTGPDKSPSLAALGDSSGDTSHTPPPPPPPPPGDSSDTVTVPPRPPADTGDTVVTPPPPPPPPPVCTANRAVLDGTVIGWDGGRMDSLKGPRVKDATVQLYRFTGDSVGGHPTQVLVATEKTNGAGKFQVKDLQVGVYRLVFIPPANSPYRYTEAYTYIPNCDRQDRTFFLLKK